MIELIENSFAQALTDMFFSEAIGDASDRLLAEHQIIALLNTANIVLSTHDSDRLLRYAREAGMIIDDADNNTKCITEDVACCDECCAETALDTEPDTAVPQCDDSSCEEDWLSAWNKLVDEVSAVSSMPMISLGPDIYIDSPRRNFIPALDTDLGSFPLPTPE